MNNTFFYNDKRWKWAALADTLHDFFHSGDRNAEAALKKLFKEIKGVGINFTPEAAVTTIATGTIDSTSQLKLLCSSASEVERGRAVSFERRANARFDKCALETAFTRAITYEEIIKTGGGEAVKKLAQGMGIPSSAEVEGAGAALYEPDNICVIYNGSNADYSYPNALKTDKGNIKVGLSRRKARKIVASFILEYMFPGYKNEDVGITFDAGGAKTINIFSEINEVKAIVTPLNIADSASSKVEFKQWGDSRTDFIFPQNVSPTTNAMTVKEWSYNWPSTFFLSSSSLEGAGGTPPAAMTVTYKDFNKSNPNGFIITVKKPQGGDILKINYDKKVDNTASGPSAPYLAKIMTVSEDGGVVPPPSTPTMIPYTDWEIGPAATDPNLRKAYVDMKRSGDYGQAYAGKDIRDQLKMFMVLGTGDVLCSLLSRLLKLPCILTGLGGGSTEPGGHALVLFRFPKKLTQQQEDAAAAASFGRKKKRIATFFIENEKAEKLGYQNIQSRIKIYADVFRKIAGAGIFKNEKFIAPINEIITYEVRILALKVYIKLTEAHAAVLKVVAAAALPAAATPAGQWFKTELTRAAAGKRTIEEEATGFVGALQPLFSEDDWKAVEALYNEQKKFEKSASGGEGAWAIVQEFTKSPDWVAPFSIASISEEEEAAVAEKIWDMLAHKGKVQPFRSIQTPPEYKSFKSFLKKIGYTLPSLLKIGAKMNNFIAKQMPELTVALDKQDRTRNSAFRRIQTLCIAFKTDTGIGKLIPMLLLPAREAEAAAAAPPAPLAAAAEINKCVFTAVKGIWVGVERFGNMVTNYFSTAKAVEVIFKEIKASPPPPSFRENLAISLFGNAAVKLRKPNCTPAALLAAVVIGGGGMNISHGCSVMQGGAAAAVAGAEAAAAAAAEAMPQQIYDAYQEFFDNIKDTVEFISSKCSDILNERLNNYYRTLRFSDKMTDDATSVGDLIIGAYSILFNLFQALDGYLYATTVGKNEAGNPVWKGGDSVVFGATLLGIIQQAKWWKEGAAVVAAAAAAAAASSSASAAIAAAAPADPAGDRLAHGVPLPGNDDDTNLRGEPARESRKTLKRQAQRTLHSERSRQQRLARSRRASGNRATLAVRRYGISSGGFMIINLLKSLQLAEGGTPGTLVWGGFLYKIIELLAQLSPRRLDVMRVASFFGSIFGIKYMPGETRVADRSRAIYLDMKKKLMSFGTIILSKAPGKEVRAVSEMTAKLDDKTQDDLTSIWSQRIWNHLEVINAKLPLDGQIEVNTTAAGNPIIVESTPPAGTIPSFLVSAVATVNQLTKQLADREGRGILENPLCLSRLYNMMQYNFMSFDIISSYNNLSPLRDAYPVKQWFGDFKLGGWIQEGAVWLLAKGKFVESNKEWEILSAIIQTLFMLAAQPAEEVAQQAIDAQKIYAGIHTLPPLVVQGPYLIDLSTEGGTTTTKYSLKPRWGAAVHTVFPALVNEDSRLGNLVGLGVYQIIHPGGGGGGGGKRKNRTRRKKKRHKYTKRPRRRRRKKRRKKSKQKRRRRRRHTRRQRR